MVVITNEHREPPPEGWPSIVKYPAYTNSEADLKETHYFADWLLSLPTSEITDFGQVETSKTASNGTSMVELAERKKGFSAHFMRATLVWLVKRSNTRGAYHREIKMFTDQCKADNHSCKVTPEIAEVYMENFIMTRTGKNKSTIAYSTADGAISAITALYAFQKEVGINDEPNPRTPYVKSMLKSLATNASAESKNSCENRDSAMHANGINERNLKLMLSTALKGQNESHFARALVTSGFYTLARGENLRMVQLADIFHEVDNESSAEAESPLAGLYILTDKSKTNKTGKKQTVGVIRHRDVEVCGVGALAFYLFERFHISNSPFPLIFNRPLWFNTKLFVLNKKFKDPDVSAWYEAAVEFMIEQGKKPNEIIHFNKNSQSKKVSFKQLNTR